MPVAAKLTVSGAVPLVAPAETLNTGGLVVCRKNQGAVVGSVLKKARSCRATFGTPPLAEGCVKSLCKSSGQSEVNPSDRPAVPSVQMYGPQESHGARTGPLAGSKFKPF